LLYLFPVIKGAPVAGMLNRQCDIFYLTFGIGSSSTMHIQDIGMQATNFGEFSSEKLIS
jgi:hypothetical protein